MACTPRGKMRLYLDQLILDVVAVARILVAIPEVLWIVVLGCAGCCLLSARFGGSVCYRCHGVGKMERLESAFAV